MNSQFIPQQIENEDVHYNITFVYLEKFKEALYIYIPYKC